MIIRTIYYDARISAQYLGRSDIGSSDIIRINKNSYPLSFLISFPFFLFFFLSSFFFSYFLDPHITRDRNGGGGGESSISLFEFSVGNTNTTRINARRVTSLFNRIAADSRLFCNRANKNIALHAQEGCPVSLGGFALRIFRNTSVNTRDAIRRGGGEGGEKEWNEIKRVTEKTR